MFFNNSHKNNTFGSHDVPEITHDGLDAACHEAFSYISDVQSAIPNAWVAMYESFNTDSSKTTEEKMVALESAGDGIFAKIKNFFKSIWDKIVGWWKSVVKFFQSMIMSDKDFISKYRKEITEKSKSKFEYQGYNFDDSVLDDLGGRVDKITGIVKNSFDIEMKMSESDKMIKLKAEIGAKIDKAKKDIERIADARDGNYSGSATAKKKLLREFRGKTDSKKTIKEFSHCTPEHMMDVLEGAKSALSDIQALQQDVTEAIKTYDDELDKAKSEYDKAGREPSKKSAFISHVSRSIALAKHGLQYQTAFLSVAKDCRVEQHREYSSVLRAFVRFTPKKEAFGITESANILDSFTAYV